MMTAAGLTCCTLFALTIEQLHIREDYMDGDDSITISLIDLIIDGWGECVWEKSTKIGWWRCWSLFCSSTSMPQCITQQTRPTTMIQLLCEPPEGSGGLQGMEVVERRAQYVRGLWWKATTTAKL